ncbi:MAG: hypothetical protein HRT35_17465 [Algicola sp.]|nr:hypothetical protein [Algicola sp.]
MRKLIVVIAIFFSQLSMASSIGNTKITAVLMGEQYGNVVFVVLSTKPATVPDCKTNGTFSYAFDPSTSVGKATLSLVLAAYTTKKEVTLTGSNSCTLYPDVENLMQIWAK